MRASLLGVVQILPFLLVACSAPDIPTDTDSKADDSAATFPGDSETATDTATPTDSSPACEPPVGSAMTQDLSETAIGSTVYFDPATLDVPDLPVATTDSGTQLLVSTTPPFVSSAGVLYREEILGPTRVFLVHGNEDATTDRAFAVTLTGMGAPAEVQILASGVGGPSDQPRYVSQVAALRYEIERATPPVPTLVSVPAGGTVTLDASLDALTSAVYQLTHAIYDLDSDVAVTLSVVTVSAGTDPAQALPELATFDGEPAGRRGTFAPTERRMDATCYDPAAGSLRVRLGGQTSDDPWISGADALSGDEVELVGNQGLHYEVHVPIVASDGRDVAVALVPRGGPAVGAVWVSAGAHAEQVLGFPRDVRELWPEGAGEYIGSWRDGEEVILRLLSASGTTWPVDLLLLPQETI